MSMHTDVFGARATLEGAYGKVTYYSLSVDQKRCSGSRKTPIYA